MNEREPSWFEARAMAADLFVERPAGLAGVLVDGSYLCSGCAVRGDHRCVELERSADSQLMVGVCTCELCVPAFRRPAGAASVLRSEDLGERVRLTENRQAQEMADCMRHVAAELRAVLADLHRSKRAGHGTRSRIRRLAADLERRADAT